MKKSTSISILFFLIFLLGILGVIVFVNGSLNPESLIEVHSASFSGTVNSHQAIQYFPGSH